MMVKKLHAKATKLQAKYRAHLAIVRAQGLRQEAAMKLEAESAGFLPVRLDLVAIEEGSER